MSVLTTFLASPVTEGLCPPTSAEQPMRVKDSAYCKWELAPQCLTCPYGEACKPNNYGGSRISPINAQPYNVAFDKFVVLANTLNRLSYDISGYPLRDHLCGGGDVQYQMGQYASWTISSVSDDGLCITCTSTSDVRAMAYRWSYREQPNYVNELLPDYQGLGQRYNYSTIPVPGLKLEFDGWSMAYNRISPSVLAVEVVNVNTVKFYVDRDCRAAVQPNIMQVNPDNPDDPMPDDYAYTCSTVHYGVHESVLGQPSMPMRGMHLFRGKVKNYYINKAELVIHDEKSCIKLENITVLRFLPEEKDDTGTVRRDASMSFKGLNKSTGEWDEFSAPYHHANKTFYINVDNVKALYDTYLITVFVRDASGKHVRDSGICKHARRIGTRVSDSETGATKSLAGTWLDYTSAGQHIYNVSDDGTNRVDELWVCAKKNSFEKCYDNEHETNGVYSYDSWQRYYNPSGMPHFEGHCYQPSCSRFEPLELRDTFTFYDYGRYYDLLWLGQGPWLTTTRTYDGTDTTYTYIAGNNGFNGIFGLTARNTRSTDGAWTSGDGIHVETWTEFTSGGAVVDELTQSNGTILYNSGFDYNVDSAYSSTPPLGVAAKLNGNSTDLVPYQSVIIGTETCPHTVLSSRKTHNIKRIRQAIILPAVDLLDFADAEYIDRGDACLHVPEQPFVWQGKNYPMRIRLNSYGNGYNPQSFWTKAPAHVAGGTCASSSTTGTNVKLIVDAITQSFAYQAGGVTHTVNVPTGGGFVRASNPDFYLHDFYNPYACCYSSQPVLTDCSLVIDGVVGVAGANALFPILEAVRCDTSAGALWTTLASLGTYQPFATDYTRMSNWADVVRYPDTITIDDQLGHIMGSIADATISAVLTYPVDIAQVRTWPAYGNPGAATVVETTKYLTDSDINGHWLYIGEDVFASLVGQSLCMEIS